MVNLQLKILIFNRISLFYIYDIYAKYIGMYAINIIFLCKMLYNNF